MRIETATLAKRMVQLDDRIALAQALHEWDHAEDLEKERLEVLDARMNMMRRQWTRPGVGEVA